MAEPHAANGVLAGSLVLGLLAGVVLAHVLQWPRKTALTGPQCLAAQNHLYGGYATFGAIA